MFIKKKLDAGISLVLLLFMGFLYHQSAEFSAGEFSTNCPQFFPLLMISIISILSLYLLLASISISGTPQDWTQRTSFRFSTGNILQIAVLVLLCLYIALLPVFSYVPATFLFLFVSMSLLGGRRDVHTLFLYGGISTLTTALLYVAFAVMLKLFLP
ncbi:tripartite tricarboxylate transporter TctB family protein [uncultured Desulfovibrio sp.]|uniref:tripartite tricarboxylate transporter TctB family protein n=1 Tax=uncultured Desulfovibrio sp. TaxID=167968 RepID=UPI00262D74BC|nr:tripartite tricarboxylate transporter TctB family protein [uncultured Desulfovibrio sp.]